MSRFRQWCSNNALSVTGILGIFLLLVGAGLILRPRLTSAILRYGLAGLNLYLGLHLLKHSFRHIGGR